MNRTNSWRQGKVGVGSVWKELLSHEQIMEINSLVTMAG
jgi:hypothetical protein